MYQSLSLTLKSGKEGRALLSSVNRGLVFVTKPSRKQNLFFFKINSPSLDAMATDEWTQLSKMAIAIYDLHNAQKKRKGHVAEWAECDEQLSSSCDTRWAWCCHIGLKPCDCDGVRRRSRSFRSSASSSTKLSHATTPQARQQFT